jgi:hypothetical protein
MMQEPISHIYRDRLDADGFRLLKIGDESREPSARGLISCQLTTHSLANSPSWFALSYAWDEPQSTHRASHSNASAKPCILLNGKQTLVKPNLYHAIRELCSRQPDIHWWIDALCINQTNSSERSAQVSIMHKIFREAERVFVWLGADHMNEANQVREFLRALLSKYMDDDMGKYEHDWLHRDDEHTLLASGLPELTHPAWKVIVRFWDRRWFSRVWVQQEVAVAGNLEFWCGCTDFTLKELVEASRFHSWSGLGETLMLLKSEKMTKSIHGRRIGCSAVGIEDLQMWANGIRFLEADDFKTVADRLTGPMSNDKHPLLRLFAVRLFLTFRDDATDGRDKIFVILVLMKQIAEAYGVTELPLEADYSKTQAKVYREATEWVIAESGCLGILCLLHPKRYLPKTNETPSWVPDYSCPPPRPLRLFTPKSSADIIQRKNEDGQGSVTQDAALYVQAKFCGTVADIGDTFESMIDDGCFEMTARLLLNCPLIMTNGSSRLDSWRETFCGEFTENPASDQSDQRADFKQWLVFIILRKLCNDYQEGRIKRARDHLAKMPSFELLAETDNTNMLPDFGFWQNVLSDPGKVENYLKHRPRFQTIEVGGRRLFRTISSVYLGYGPEGVEPGDEIWVVAGSTFPLVLRPVSTPNSSPAEANPHVVVGEAYLNDSSCISSKLHDRDWQRLKLQ